MNSIETSAAEYDREEIRAAAERIRQLARERGGAKWSVQEWKADREEGRK